MNRKYYRASFPYMSGSFAQPKKEKNKATQSYGKFFNHRRAQNKHQQSFSVCFSRRVRKKMDFICGINSKLSQSIITPKTNKCGKNSILLMEYKSKLVRLRFSLPVYCAIWKPTASSSLESRNFEPDTTSTSCELKPQIKQEKSNSK